MVHASLARELGKQREVALLFLVDGKVGDTKVVKRREHVLAQSVLQGDLVGDHMVEQGEDVIAVGSIGGRRHAQAKLWFKVLENALVALRTYAMGLVNDDVVEQLGVYFVKIAADGRTHRKGAGELSSIATGPIQAVRVVIPQQLFVARH